MQTRQRSTITFLTIFLILVSYLVSSAEEYKYTTIAYPGALRTDVYGINDSGQIVGEYYDGSVTHGFLFDNGNFATIDYPGADYLTSLQGINNNGQIVGRYQIYPGSEHGFIYEGGSFTTIDHPSKNTALRGINDSDEIVGRSQFVGGFLYKGGAFTLIKGSNPRGINNLGEIVGENGPQFGFYEHETTFKLIEYPGGVVRTEAGGINDASTIVGYYSLNDLYVRHGFIYDGEIYSTLDYPGSTNTFLRDINNSGEIIANINLNGQSLGALMTPFSETITVGIDIKPGSGPNSINPKSRGEIPVAILSMKDFDAPKMADRDSLTFGSTGDEDSLAFCNPKGEDINGDGLKDLICHFYTECTGFECGDTEGALKGMTMDGMPILGYDLVRINPCK